MPPEHVLPEGVIPIALAVLAALLLVMAIWWLWWRLPKREAARLALKIRDPKARADVEDNFRKTVGQALGGIAVLLGAGLAYLQFSQQQRASHDLLISNQVSKGFEQLGSEKVVVRLGGIYALEGVMNNSDQYHQAVLEELTAFVREGKRDNTTSTYSMHMLPALPRDIQAALTVIGRRSPGPGVVNLIVADIAIANLAGANLADANLAGANLADANLLGTHLTGANLTRARLSRADLRGADLRGASLLSAHLAWANLADASLLGADLSDADLTRANLTGAQIDQRQLDETCGSDAVLPRGLTLKPCSSQSPP
jgi:uncharacterized protein YjbI with pentapeptide repeats